MLHRLDDLRFFNTRTKLVEAFAPLNPPHVGIYTCGPTVYAPQHLGNMRSQLLPDLLRRVITASGHDVTFVTNITDVGHLVADRDDTEDKMEKAAAERGETAAQIASRYTEQWAVDRHRLGCLEPDVVPKATEHIDEQISLVQTLEQRGHTYRLPDGVYFDVSTFAGYADFARLDLDALATSGRVEAVSEKRHPADFALWKLTPEGIDRQQEWDSPWGRGFPGWHIECSAMATKYLGTNFDIHTGGVDHVRVHHTNEVAQSECALDTDSWVTLWMHTEFLDLSGRKVSKSDGDVLLVDTLVARGIDPLAFRYFFFQAHYRSQQSFTWDSLESAATAYRRLIGHAVEARKASDPANAELVEPHLRKFWGALADDLNAPQALAALWDVLRADNLGAAERWMFLADVDRALGFDLAHVTDPNSDESGSDARIDALVAQRDAAREAKDFATSDRVRDELAGDGVTLIDTPNGTIWHRED